MKENVASTSGVPPHHVQQSKTKRATPAPKRSVASLMSLDCVTGHPIVYAAVWQDFFESPPGPIAKLNVECLLNWWNMYVLNLSINWTLCEGDTCDSSVQRINAIPAARKVGLNIVPTLP
ncbi:hypothetical protein C8R43DRAFT_944882 [Mycena crocata]|nr:hypothetical protein C8R43DRAFT_944882 [Mycena crocata]